MVFKIEIFKIRFLKLKMSGIFNIYNSLSCMGSVIVIMRHSRVCHPRKNYLRVIYASAMFVRKIKIVLASFAGCI